jgi:glycosyltransferase involved in cell wall biosynthesis
MGPVVVLEAFAAGVPVVGSALGGVEEKITDGVDGLLVRPHDSVRAWADAIERCARDRDLLSRLRQGVRPPRESGDVARDMQQVYLDVVSGRAATGFARSSTTPAGVVA